MGLATMSVRRERASVVTGSAWMLLLGILLVWIPIVGPFIAGFIGGRKVGTVGRALVAAILPAILVAVLVFIVASIVEAPLLGFIASLGLLVWIVIESLPLFVGAAVGGFVADREVRLD